MEGWYSEQWGVCRRAEQLRRSVSRGGEADDNTDDTLSSFIILNFTHILACVCVCVCVFIYVCMGAHIFVKGMCACVCVHGCCCCFVSTLKVKLRL